MTPTVVIMYLMTTQLLRLLAKMGVDGGGVRKEKPREAWRRETVWGGGLGKKKTLRRERSQSQLQTLTHYSAIPYT